jgi:hypothetical protein
MSNRAVVPARKAGNRFLSSLKGLQIRALAESDFILLVFIKRRGSEIFNKFACPPSCESPLKFASASLLNNWQLCTQSTIADQKARKPINQRLENLKGSHKDRGRPGAENPGAPPFNKGPLNKTTFSKSF